MVLGSVESEPRSSVRTVDDPEFLPNPGPLRLDTGPAPRAAP